MEIKFQIPAWMKPPEVAQTFTAYLLGAGAFDNPDQRRGPYQLRGCDASWQLEGSNDYTLHVDGRDGMACCRYADDEETLKAMVALFNAHVAKID